ncbi:hypothetical protein DCAR_0207050 [Daucus carota subsp. sativus]|uniref:Exocyst subunit Exo70 family protein n=1 Tax=Daucus carota subsp. sativus TaxID=79200 RepID=A0A166DLZ1_DAUCS|nr:PREDICTED: exocyst complex component EXO70A1-like [Daucus carota subsp. sativus]WOG87818.1 hypothetical protein DCAR_0207050 [Daucus carota subsp. sativus]
MTRAVELDRLIAARDVLRNGIAESRDMAWAISEAGCRLEEMNQRLPALEGSLKNIARKCEMNKFHVDHAVGPAAAVLSIYNVVIQLQEWLVVADLRDSDVLIPYVYQVKRLEEALGFLTQNCKLAVLWLEDVVELVENNAVRAQYNHCFFSGHVRKSLGILRNLQAMEERSRLDGGLLHAAFTNLQKEFRHLLVQNTYPLKQQTNDTDSTAVSLLAYPVPVVEKLQLILERLTANNQLDRCVSIYTEVRAFNLQATVQALDFGYLETTSLSEFDSLQSVESCIEKWSDDLEFVVKHLLELEYRASNAVFNREVDGLDVANECFAKTVMKCGLLQRFIKFANTITRGKKEAVKLLKLLDIFESLNKLRMNFNRLFGGQTCVEIQSQMRDLIKKVINEACDIFWELPAHVESQRQSTPPADGGIPRLLSFVVDYSNELLSEYYRPILTQVLEIHWSWNCNHAPKEDLEKQRQQFLLNEELHYKKIMKALELNIQAWGRTYKDSTLSYIFLMNSHWYLCNNLKGTEIGDVMGDLWLRGHEECVEHYSSVFVRESWGRLAPLLTEEDEGLQVLLSGGGTAVLRDSMKRRIKAFTEAFDEMYRKQCHWVVPDTGLRWKICQLLVRAVVPVYSNFILSCISNLEAEAAEKDGNFSPTLAGKRCVNNSKESLENMLCSLFQPKLAKKHGASAKSRHLIGKIKNVVTNHFLSTSAAA